MTYGIAGNTVKNELWGPVTELVTWMNKRHIDWCLHAPVADGLAERTLVPSEWCATRSTVRLANHCDIILSFGGDGTLLRTAHEVNDTSTPILGVNIGHLGFLADVEASQVRKAVEHLEAGRYEVGRRMVLEVTSTRSGWALNDAVVARAGTTGLIALDVTVNGTTLNRYRADGLLVATPTGSTAYSLAVGGPIVMPGSDVVIVSPIASHSLTVRPVVLPASSVIEVSVRRGPTDCVLALDGRTEATPRVGDKITIRRAAHTIHLVQLPGQHYFKVLRNKLAWGLGPQEKGLTMFRIRTLTLICLAAFIAGGCARTKSLPATASLPTLDATTIIDRVQAHILPSTVRAAADLSAQTPVFSGSVNASIAHRRNDSLLATFAVKGLGMQAARLLVTPDSFFLYDRLTREITQDKDTKSPFGLFKAQNAMQNLLGLMVPDPAVTWEVQTTAFGYMLRDATGGQTYVVDAEQWRVINFESRLPSGELAESLHFDEFHSFDNRPFPRRITYRNGPQDIAVQVYIRELTLDEGVGSLRLEAPPDAVRLPYVPSG